MIRFQKILVSAVVKKVFSDHETARRRGRWLGLKSESALPSERLDSTPWARATALPRSHGTKESKSDKWKDTLSQRNFLGTILLFPQR